MSHGLAACRRDSCSGRALVGSGAWDRQLVGRCHSQWIVLKLPASRLSIAASSSKCFGVVQAGTDRSVHHQHETLTRLFGFVARISISFRSSEPADLSLPGARSPTILALKPCWTPSSGVLNSKIFGSRKRRCCRLMERSSARRVPARPDRRQLLPTGQERRPNSRERNCGLPLPPFEVERDSLRARRQMQDDAADHGSLRWNDAPVVGGIQATLSGALAVPTKLRRSESSKHAGVNPPRSR
jgi:hypothetical protein